MTSQSRQHSWHQLRRWQTPPSLERSSSEPWCHLSQESGPDWLLFSKARVQSFGLSIDLPPKEVRMWVTILDPAPWPTCVVSKAPAFLYVEGDNRERRLTGWILMKRVKPKTNSSVDIKCGSVSVCYCPQVEVIYRLASVHLILIMVNSELNL